MELIGAFFLAFAVGYLFALLLIDSN